MTRAKPTADSPIDLHAAVAASTTDVRIAWRAYLASVPAARDLARAQDFARLFDLKSKLAWQFWRAVNADGPVEMLEHLPGGPGLRLLFSALESKPGARAAAQRLQASLSRFQKLARVHASGDRGAFVGMLAQLDPTRRERLDRQHREAGFHAARNLWGVQAQSVLAISILHPGIRPNLMDVVALRATIGFQRLRADTPWFIARVGCRPRTSEGSGDPAPGQGPLSPRRETIFPTKPGQPSIIHELSSNPLPPFRVLPRTQTLADIMLQPGPVGELAAMDIVSGDVFRNLPRFHDPAHTPEITPILLTPCQTYMHDLIVHDGAEIDGSFHVEAYGDPRGEGLESAESRARVPGALSAELVGRGPQALHLPDIPRYREYVQATKSRLRWHSESFTVYRVRWEWPATPSMVAVKFRLPSQS